MRIEICANSLTSALNAQKAGANRVELCAELSLGGITPSAGMIALVRKQLKIDVFVLIRPRGGDFCYTSAEIEIIQEDIKFCKKIGCDGVVLGVLKSDGTINKTVMKKLVELARPMQVTFHRAFDICKNPFNALEQIIELGIERILTSGQQNRAIDGLSFLEKLVHQSKHRLSVMAGSGVNATNVLHFQKIGIQEVHFSAKKLTKNAMIFEHPIVQLETNPYINCISNIKKIKEVIEQIKTKS